MQIFPIRLALFSVIATSVPAKEPIFYSYDLPTNKRYVRVCDEKIRAAHLGQIEHYYFLNIRHKGWMVFGLQIPNKKMEYKTCDLDNGDIIQEPNITAPSSTNNVESNIIEK
jgi:hypothetical protein